MGDISIVVSERLGVSNLTNTMEEWKSHPKILNVEVSNLGRVRNSVTGHIYKQGIDRYGYPKLSLSTPQGKVYVTVHRLVAVTWIPNPDCKPQVNHINGVKTDNTVDNLEWNTARENIYHSFVTGLNGNRFSVRLIDIATDEEIEFGGFKSMSRYIDCTPSVVVPLAKNSYRNPILGRYVVKVSDEEMLKNTQNTVRCGVGVSVLDHLTGELVTYTSILLAEYFTGIRSMWSANWSTGPVDYIGYSIGSNPAELTGRVYKATKDEIYAERERYLLTPYRQRTDDGYRVYDYYSGLEYVLDTLSEVIQFLNQKDPVDVKVSVAGLRTAVSKSGSTCGKHLRTGLSKGFGVKRDDGSDTEWTEYSEEVIISSKYGCLAPKAIYRVQRLGEEPRVVIGKHSLCIELGYRIDGSEDHQLLDRYIKRFNEASDFSFVRLNTPIKR